MFIFIVLFIVVPISALLLGHSHAKKHGTYDVFKSE